MRNWIKIVETEESSDDKLRATIINLVNQLPFIWRDADGSTHYKNLHIESFMKDKDHEWLLGALDNIREDLSFLKSNPKNVLQRNIGPPPIPPRQKKTLQTMMTNIGGIFTKWFREENPGEPFDKNDLETFNDYLKSELNISVRPDGLIEFWTLNRVVSKAIGALPTVLFHYTSSTLSKTIKVSGLLSDMESVNDRKADGVYLTTETSGPAIRGYALRARSAHGGYPVCVIVKAFLHELEPDPDDEDISSGRHQFRVDHVPPDRILKIERAIV